MPFFSQRKMSLQIAFIYSFNKAHSFIHLTNIGCASPLWGPCLSHGDSGVKMAVCAPTSPQPLPHPHTMQRSLPQHPRRTSLSSCCNETGFKGTSRALRNSKPTPPRLFPTNPKGWEPQILYKVCGATSHPTLRNSLPLSEPESAWELSSWRPLVVHREWGD